MEGEVRVQEGNAGPAPKRKPGRTKGLGKQQAVAAASAAAASAPRQSPASATAEANELHGVAPEPAGPVPDAEQNEVSKKRKGRTTSSVSQIKQVREILVSLHHCPCLALATAYTLA